jgi:beta-phosphoglucomutase
MQQTCIAIIWDMDGVLVDSGDFHYRAWRETLKAVMNTDISYDAFQRTFGLRNLEMLRDHLGYAMTIDEVNRLSGIKEARYRELIHLNGMNLLPGVKQWLDHSTASGWRQAVASSAPRENVEAVVDAVNIRGYFNAMVSAEDVSRGKPDPEVFLSAAAKLGIPPSRCIVIEDAPVGIQGARSAGMKCIGVLTTHERLEADVVVNRLSDAPFAVAVDLLTRN